MAPSSQHTAPGSQHTAPGTQHTVPGSQPQPRRPARSHGAQHTATATAPGTQPQPSTQHTATAPGSQHTAPGSQPQPQRPAHSRPHRREPRIRSSCWCLPPSGAVGFPALSPKRSSRSPVGPGGSRRGHSPSSFLTWASPSAGREGRVRTPRRGRSGEERGGRRRAGRGEPHGAGQVSPGLPSRRPGAAPPRSPWALPEFPLPPRGHPSCQPHAFSVEGPGVGGFPKAAQPGTTEQGGVSEGRGAGRQAGSTTQRRPARGAAGPAHVGVGSGGQSPGRSWAVHAE